jgi:predicted nucleic acid-binding protein
MSKVFLDTNLLVYTMDSYDTEKKQQCRSLLKTVTRDMQGVISTQVMQEFYVAATRKLGADPLTTKDVMNAFTRFEVVGVTPDIINSAVDCSILNRLSFWDALIVAAAESAHCDFLWTEDLNNGQVIRGVKVENPLLS